MSGATDYHAVIHAVVNRVGRHFGFQAFNTRAYDNQPPKPTDEQKKGTQGVQPQPLPPGGHTGMAHQPEGAALATPTRGAPPAPECEWTPATIFLVTDHLHHLLVKNYMPRDVGCEDEGKRFARAVWMLHHAIFTGYRDWCRHVELPERVKELHAPGPVSKMHSVGEPSTAVEVTWFLLEELSLYFLVYTEGANLRHTPEALWLIFWLLRNSPERWEVASMVKMVDQAKGIFKVDSTMLCSSTHIRLRKLYGGKIAEWRSCSEACWDGMDINMLARARKHAMQLLSGAGFTEDVAVLEEMVLFGDSGPFVDKVVDPIFAFLAIQVFKMGMKGEEIGQRIAYDDINESLASKDVVQKVKAQLSKQGSSGKDPLEALLATGMPTVTNDAVGVNMAGKEIQAVTAEGWWAAKFGKTYVERRSLFTMYRTFYRVWVLFILEFQVMASLLWAPGNTYVLSYTCLTHAFLSLLEQGSGWWTQGALREQPRHSEEEENRRSLNKALPGWLKLPIFSWMGWMYVSIIIWWQRPKRLVKANLPQGHRHMVGMAVWLAILALMGLALVVQLTDKSRSIWWIACVTYTAGVVAYAVLGTRDGYCVSVNNTIASFLGRYKDNEYLFWITKPMYWLFEFLGKTSARPPAKAYLAPYHMKVGWGNFFTNILFWIFVFAMKFAFDWFAVMKQMEGAVRGLWDRDWANGPDDKGADGDIFLCAARCLPGFLVMFNDAQVFYYIAMALFGFIKGFIQLNLGNVTTFQQLVTSFHKAPTRWWKACVPQALQPEIAQARQPGSGEKKTKGSNNSGQETPMKSSQSESNSSSTPGSPPTVEDSAVYHSSPKPLKSVPAPVPLPESCPAKPCPSPSGGTPLKTKQAAAATTLVSRTPNPQVQASWWKQCWGAERSKVHMTFNDENIPKWQIFSRVWNEIVVELRSIDLLSDAELGNLLFVQLCTSMPGIKEPQALKFPHGVPSRGFIPPVFFYGGQVNRLLEVPGVDSGQELAIKDMASMLVWILFQLNIVDESTTTRSSERRHQRQEALKEVLALLDGISKLSVKTDDKVAKGIRKNLEKLSGIMEDEAKAVQAQYSSIDDRHLKASRLNEAISGLKGNAEDGAASRVDPKPPVLKEGEWVRLVEPELKLLSASTDANEATKKLVPQVARQLKKMLETNAKQAAPVGDEALRVLTWFMSSLKTPTIPNPASVEHMLSFNTLTPHYEEDVVYALNAAQVGQALGGLKIEGLSDLTTENEDGITVMQWLRSAYPHDWHNLLERLKKGHKELFRSFVDDRYISEKDFEDGGVLAPLREELLLWASYRGQLLARTVRGIMAYKKAIRLLASLEHPRPELTEEERKAWLDELVASKYTYIVASQVYGANRDSDNAKGRWLARGTEMLLHRFPGLRVAFVDTLAKDSSRAKQQWSVLIKAKQLGEGQQSPLSDLNTNFTEEIYRIRLPQSKLAGHGVILGEGKPENQNASIIFCFGEVVQAIDMNQDNNLAEALKMRNLLSEFEVPMHPGPPASQGRRRNGHANSDGEVVAWPNMDDKKRRPVCLVGFREYIFSQDSGALASFAAATELAFGSMVQRVMQWPGCVRFHYGHPDLWSKLFIMTRGGVSKATKGFHISEDVFAGYNHTQRGGRVKFAEYINVGKGRDMGFDSILGFEAKVAGGNGEQVMSRDVHRLATQFDFFRLLSFYHSGCGFYINTYLVMLSVYIAIWVSVVLALTNSQTLMDPETGDQINTLTGEVNSESVQQIVQLGMLSIVVYMVELILTTGILRALGTILVQIIQGSILFYIFRSRTAAYYFKTDVQYGGAKYVATGRGYQLKHNSFVHVYSMYGRSHIYYAMELVVMMVLLGLIGSDHYWDTTWSAWLVAVAILWSPFWFNPQTFQPERVKEDFEGWRAWMGDRQEKQTKSTWYSWNKAQLEKPRDDNRTQTNRFSTALLGALGCIPTAFLGIVAVSSIENTNLYKWELFGLVTLVFWLTFMAGMLIRRSLIGTSRYRIWRMSRLVSLILAIGCAIAAIVLAAIGNHGGVGLANMLILAFANVQMVVVLVQCLLFFAPSWRAGRCAVDRCYKLLDWAIGYCLFFFLFICSILLVFNLIQGGLLFNLRFSKALQRARLLEANFLTNYVEKEVDKKMRSPGPKAGESGSEPPGGPAAHIEAA